MKKYAHLLIWLLTAYCNLLVSQDTLLLRNKTQVICTVTRIYPERIEYLNFGDSVKKQFYSYKKSDVVMVRYAGGKVDTFSKQAVALLSDTNSLQENQYEKGVDDGFERYRPTEERWAGVCAAMGNFIIPACIVVPIVYSVTKVPARKIQDNQYIVSKNDSYKRGYLEGATKRRRRAVWTSYGITTGAAIAGLVGFVVLVF
jgi:hypothetical protein